jgi:hypothetical protein
MRRQLYLFIFFIVTCHSTFSQSSINPDISLIGTFNAFTNFNKGSEGYGKLNFENPSMELFIDGYLNPFARATANVAYEDGEFGVEELYGNIVRGLPLDMQIKAGKFLVGFGKINTVHPHAWPFLERPLFQQVFFGPEGLNDVGVNVSFLLPTDEIYSTLDLGVFRGESIQALSDSNAVERGINPIFVGRLGTFLNLSDYSNLDFGVSSSYGVYSKALSHLVTEDLTNPDKKSLKYMYGGVDLKYKYSPDSYTAFTLQGEALINRRDVNRQEDGEYKFTKMTNYGGTIFADYKFMKQFSIGMKYDYTSGIIDDRLTFNTLMNDDKNSTQGIEGWFSFYPVEETSALRLGVQHLTFKYADGIEHNSETTIKLQFLFSLGPHKAHPF